MAPALLLLLLLPHHPSTLESQYGRLETDRQTYRPLDTVRLNITGRAKPDTTCRIRVADPQQHTYFEKDVDLTNNKGQLQFPATGALGVHYIYLHFPNEKRYSRYLNFRLDAESSIDTGDRDFDALLPFTREAMQLGRRDYMTPRGRFVGYISADTWHFDGIWLRDWIYSLPGYKHWEREMQCGLDRFLEVQREDGQTPDGIERDGRTWRVGLESDVEYILTLGVWDTWRATGKGASRHVIATCDSSGYYQAFRAMSAMDSHLGHAAKAQEWSREADGYAERSKKLLWDGAKFLHHVHLDKIDHDGFDESKQLAMGNTWAVTRGLALPSEAVKVIDEYRRRWRETGDKYPWWSLQPGYPDSLGYWKDPYRLQGAYANGGLMPWVGGELARGALQNGREDFGVQLIRQYANHLRETGGAQVWYFPDGTPGFRTTNEVRYAGWGMAQWIGALVEGLAGIRDTGSMMRAVEISPRWAATGISRARATSRYAASNGYFSYMWTAGPRALNIDYSGSSDHLSFRILLPRGFNPRTVTVDGAALKFEREVTGGSVYLRIDPENAQRGVIRIAAQ